MEKGRRKRKGKDGVKGGRKRKEERESLCNIWL